jgi:hypothetical protein
LVAGKLTRGRRRAVRERFRSRRFEECGHRTSSVCRCSCRRTAEALAAARIKLPPRCRTAAAIDLAGGWRGEDEVRKATRIESVEKEVAARTGSNCGSDMAGKATVVAAIHSDENANARAVIRLGAAFHPEYFSRKSAQSIITTFAALAAPVG